MKYNSTKLPSKNKPLPFEPYKERVDRFAEGLIRKVFDGPLQMSFKPSRFPY